MDEQVTLKDLVPDLGNRRKRTERSAGMIAKSLEEVGAGRSILIDEDNRILAGNGVVDGCAEIGLTKVKIIDAEGDELIAVRRSNLTEEQKVKAALYDNRTAELSIWDAAILQQDVHNGVDFSPFFSEKELQKILKTTPVELSTKETTLVTPLTCPSCGHTFVPGGGK